VEHEPGAGVLTLAKGRDGSSATLDAAAHQAEGPLNPGLLDQLLGLLGHGELVQVTRLALHARIPRTGVCRAETRFYGEKNGHIEAFVQLIGPNGVVVAELDAQLRQCVPTVAPQTGLFDIGPVQRWWDTWFAAGRWPVEDLYYGLIQRFLRSVRVVDPAGLAATKGRPVLYLANHQVAVESLIFSIVAPAVQGSRTVTVAKVEHRQSWMGTLMAHNFQWPGVTDPEVITFFDRSDRDSLPKIIRSLAEGMQTQGNSVMVHVEGTRSLSCRRPVEKLSGAFLDMAAALGIPIVPIRFSGGLPAEPLEERIDFPFGMGQQDIWFGSPILPETLTALPYKDRKNFVMDALNNLGPNHQDEAPNPRDAGFQSDVDAWMSERGVSEANAVLYRVLEACGTPCSATRAVVEAGRGTPIPSQEDPVVEHWIRELANRLTMAIDNGS
jgi:1-acyl-sn-glycerol-3-phosphate acyltransferase